MFHPARQATGTLVPVGFAIPGDAQPSDGTDPDNAIVSDAFVSDGWTGGFHVTGGLRFRVSHDIAVVTEGRYQWAKTKMGDDFAATEAGFENEIDLSGWSATVGVHIRF